MDQPNNGSASVAADATPRTAGKPFVVGRRGTMRSTGYGPGVRWQTVRQVGTADETTLVVSDPNAERC